MEFQIYDRINGLEQFYLKIRTCLYLRLRAHNSIHNTNWTSLSELHPKKWHPCHLKYTRKNKKRQRNGWCCSLYYFRYLLLRHYITYFLPTSTSSLMVSDCCHSKKYKTLPGCEVDDSDWLKEMDIFHNFQDL